MLSVARFRMVLALSEEGCVEKFHVHKIMACYFKLKHSISVCATCSFVSMFHVSYENE